MPAVVDIPYFIHWCACLWCLFPTLFSLVVSPIVDLSRHQPLAWASLFSVGFTDFYIWLVASGTITDIRLI